MGEGMNTEELVYVGFWWRVVAAIIDTVLILLFTMPILVAIYGTQYFASTRMVHGAADILVSWVLPAAVIIAFWLLRGATPGKMAMSARIVDAETGGPLTPIQSVVRYLGYFVSIIPLFVGIFWVAFDRRKQGWHDKLAGTVVVRPKHGTPARFNTDTPAAQRREPGI